MVRAETRKKLSLWLIICLFFINSSAFAASISDVPVDIQVSLFKRLFYFHKGISSGGDISVYVIGSHEFVRAMRKEVGKKIGKSKLAEVISGDRLPDRKPSVIYINDSSKVKQVLKYTRQHKVLSITGIDTLVQEGVTLGLGVKDNKPIILLNLTSSVQEGVDWNHAILKVAATVK